MVLTHTVRMNIKMDSLAKATIDGQATRPQWYHIAGKPWICYINGQQQVKNVSTALRNHLNTIIIAEHWEHKQRYKVGQASMIDFEMAG